MKRCDVDTQTYNRVHAWIRYNYGPADRCENRKCPKDSVNFQWALKKGYVYESKRRNFLRLCAPCHHRFDFTEDFREKMRRVNHGSAKTHCIRGHEFTEKSIRYRVGKSSDKKTESRWRVCRACQSIRDKRYKLQKKLSALEKQQ